MSAYFDKYEVQANKMRNLMEENGLLHTFQTDRYPITMTVQPNNSASDQMQLFETSTDGVSSQDAKLVLQFLVGDIVVRVYGRLVISDALMGKIKNQAKKMRDLWLQADFAERLAQKSNESSTYDDDTFSEFFEDEEDEDGTQE